jgi:Flp pilus assembly protein TadG
MDDVLDERGVDLSRHDPMRGRKESTMPGVPTRGRAERGQIVVLFALALVAIVAMVGLVLDGGSAFAQRRASQNAADLAALAGANTYLLTGDETTSTIAARANAATNGFTHGTDGTTVAVAYDLSNGAAVRVTITSPHRNNFASVVGMPTWDVSTTAQALTGIPDTVFGAGPMIFSIDAFDSNGTPLPQYADPANPFPFGDTNNDAPETPGDFAWTNYGTGNVDTNEVRNIIDGDLVIEKTLAFGEYIGQHNQGNHTALYTEVHAHLAGTEFPVPIVDHNGIFQGWATFHVVSAVGASDKDVNGYFVSPFLSARLTVGGCSAGTCPRYFGTYALHLVD